MPQPNSCGDTSVDNVVALEQAAVRRCQNGEIEGLEVLYGVYAERVFRTCLRILGDQAEAEDQAQEVFVRVFEQIRRFDGRSRFATWLYRLAVNHTLNRLRQHKRRLSRLRDLVHPVEVPQGDLPDRGVLQAESADRVQALLGQLSTDHRTILVLREIEELAYAEIAEILGIAKGTVMSRLHRARQELKRCWLDAQDRNTDTNSNVQRQKGRS